MANIKEIMDTLDDAQLKKFYNDMSILTDGLGRALIAKIGGPHSPMFIDEVPLKGFSKGESINRLYQLENGGIFTSKMEKKGHGYVRKFYPTEIGKKLAKDIPLEEK